MRGEYVHQIIQPTFMTGSPPHARGILAGKSEQAMTPGITPACAGNTSFGKNSCPINGDHPRMRGEYQMLSLFCSPFLGSPPHARGIHSSNVCDSGFTGITPACAGNTHYRYIDFPVPRGSPPHARGILSFVCFNATSQGITPACAGNTSLFRRCTEPSWDHPRMRGEYHSF